MDKKKTQQDYTKNIFKNGDAPDKRQLSQKWVELINRQEKAKAAKIVRPTKTDDITFMACFVLNL